MENLAQSWECSRSSAATNFGSLIPTMVTASSAAVGDAGNNEAVHDIGETLDGRLPPFEPPAAFANPEELGNGIAADHRNPLNENSNYCAAVWAFVSLTLANAMNDRLNPLPSNAHSPSRGGRLYMLLVNPLGWGSPNTTATSPASNVHLEVYSSTSTDLKSDYEEDKAVSEAVSKIHARAKYNHTRLNSLLQSS